MSLDKNAFSFQDENIPDPEPVSEVDSKHVSQNEFRRLRQGIREDERSLSQYDKERKECHLCGIDNVNHEKRDRTLTLSVHLYSCPECDRYTTYRRLISGGFCFGENGEYDICDNCGYDLSEVSCECQGAERIEKVELQMKDVLFRNFRVSHEFHEHHVSYDPERTISVCSDCHSEIHHTSKYPGLKPKQTRKEAGIN